MPLKQKDVTDFTVGPPLGVVEGFFGRQWSDTSRYRVIEAISDLGFSNYLYAPKGEIKLRKEWREPWTDDELINLTNLVNHTKKNKIELSVGLSPLGLSDINSASDRKQLAVKLDQLIALGIQKIAVLFDDMSGATEKTAYQQLKIIDFVYSKLVCDNPLICPSYYSTDPVLEKVFGKMPENYWSDLGAGLDASIDFFWTGEKVCSSEYSRNNLEYISGLFCRKPCLWDNYPVNDGERLSQFLHLMPFYGREKWLVDYINMHFANPMNQPLLSLIPLSSLPGVYSIKGTPESFWLSYLQKALPEILVKEIKSDIEFFQNAGLNQMQTGQKGELTRKYNDFCSLDEWSHPESVEEQNCYEVAKECCHEIVTWLKGEYPFDSDCLTE